MAKLQTPAQVGKSVSALPKLKGEGLTFRIFDVEKPAEVSKGSLRREANRLKSELLVCVAQRESAEREVLRVRAHVAVTDGNMSKHKRALRAAVLALRALADDGNVKALRALAEVAQVDGGFISDAFCWPTKGPKVKP